VHACVCESARVPAGVHIWCRGAHTPCMHPLDSEYNFLNRHTIAVITVCFKSLFFAPLLVSNGPNYITLRNFVLFSASLSVNTVEHKCYSY